MVKLKKDEFTKLVKEAHEERTEANVSLKDTEGFVEDVFNAIETALLNGDSIPLGKLGLLEPRERSARKGRSPATGEEIDIPASTSVGFKLGKYLKDKLKNK